MDLSGSKLRTIKYKNMGLVLRMILMGLQTNRSDISKELGLTKTTLTNIVSELIECGIIEEKTAPEPVPCSRRGRKSVRLALSDKAPLICGITLLREKITLILADMQGNIHTYEERTYTATLRLDEMKAYIAEMYAAATDGLSRRILATGVASVGPVDSDRGLVLKPKRFYEEDEEFAVCDFVENLTGTKVFFSHDITAAVSAETLYGCAGQDSNFIYVSIIKGLGVGLFLNSRPFSGIAGQNGELGHISIDYRGELCECGRRGCVEKYIDIAAVKRRAHQYADVFPNHLIFNKADADIFDIIHLADENDDLSLLLLKDYCTYLATALSALTLSLGVNKIYISNSPDCIDGIFERILEREINDRSYVSEYQQVCVRGSGLGLQAFVYGSVAIVVERIFNGEITDMLVSPA